MALLSANVRMLTQLQVFRIVPVVFVYEQLVASDLIEIWKAQRLATMSWLGSPEPSEPPPFWRIFSQSFSSLEEFLFSLVVGVSNQARNFPRT